MILNLFLKILQAILNLIKQLDEEDLRKIPLWQLDEKSRKKSKVLDLQIELEVHLQE